MVQKLIDNPEGRGLLGGESVCLGDPKRKAEKSRGWIMSASVLCPDMQYQFRGHEGTNKCVWVLLIVRACVSTLYHTSQRISGTRLDVIEIGNICSLRFVFSMPRGTRTLLIVQQGCLSQARCLKNSDDQVLQQCFMALLPAVMHVHCRYWPVWVTTALDSNIRTG